MKKRTAILFPILFVKDFGNLKDEGGRGVEKVTFLEDVLCGRSLMIMIMIMIMIIFIYPSIQFT